MKILVTGGAGFIGTNCIIYLNSKGHKIINVDKLGIGSVKRNLEYTNAEFQKIDLSKKFPIELLNSTELIINFASESHVDRSIREPYEFYKNNVGLMINLLESMRKTESKIKLVHISTDEVYGDILDGSFDEDAALRPSSPYSASKASQDAFALAYSRTYGLDISITRCSNNYGPFQLPEKLIPKTIIRALLNKKIPVYGSGKQIRDWLFVQDHCSAIELVALMGKKGEIYNISAGNELPNIEIIRKILRSLGKDENLIEYVEDRKGHDFRYSMNSDKIRAIGWKPKTALDEGLFITVDWYVKNRDWWENLIRYI